MNINDFRIEKKSDVYSQSEKLVSFIDEKVEQDTPKKIIRVMSEASNIPDDVIKFEFKRFLAINHNFQIGKFDKFFKISNIFLYSLYYFITLIFICIFSKKKKEKEVVDIIFDEIFSTAEIPRILKIKEKFNSYKIISNLALEKNFNHMIYSKHRGCVRNFLFPKIYKLFIFYFYKIFKLSLLERTNFIPFALDVLKKTFKYETVFQQVEAKFLYQERHYTTSAIKNFLFKKYGGKICSCTQRVLIHLGRTSFFICADIFFSFGNQSASILKLTGSNIKKIIPIGSVSYNSAWIESEKIPTPKYDVLYLGGIRLPFFSTDVNYLNNYYEQLNWLKKLKKDFPSLKIAIKHHENHDYFDNREIQIMKNSGIETIIKSKEGKTNYSYGFANNALIRLTWASTMGYELIGHGLPCYYLDPNLENVSFLHKENYNKIWRIESYLKLKEKVKNIIDKKNIEPTYDKNDFCLDSQNVSNRIFDALK